MMRFAAGSTRRLILLGVASMVSAAFGTSATTEPALIARIGSIVDARKIEIQSDSGYGGDLGVQVYLKVAGLPANEPLHGYGNWIIEKAEDDRGTDIRPRKADPDQEDSNKFTSLDTSDSNASTTDAPAAGATANGATANGAMTAPTIAATAATEPTVDAQGFSLQPFKLQLGETPRAATLLRVLKGQFTVWAGGNEHTARFEHAESLRGQMLQDETMKKAGISIELLKPDWQPREGESKSTQPSDVDLRIHAGQQLDDDAIDILDRDGKSVLAGHDFMAAANLKDPASTYHLQQPLDGTMTIIVKTNLNQRQYVVPFDLHDIKLP